MAKTFYGYAERDAESYVDWSQIGSDISEMLNEEISRRVTLKADLDKASREYGETLANAPTGEHKGATDFITDLTSNAMQARLVQDRLLKSGQLKVKDYLLMRENLKSGTQQVFDVAKKFQEEYTRKTERMTKNESAAYEQELFKLTEGFSNFNNSGAYINPTNYQVSLAKKERVEVGDGNYVYQMSKNPSEFFTVAELNNFASADVDRFDIAGAVSNIASQIGERVNQTYSMDPSKKSFIIQAISDPTGDVYEKMYKDGDLTKEDIDVVIDFQNQIKKEIQAVTANRFNALSVYTDAMAGFKGFTFNEDEQGDGMVLLDKDPAGGLPTPNFKNKKGEELLIDIEKNILNRIKVRLDQSVTATGTQIKVPSPSQETGEKMKQRRANQRGEAAKDLFLYDLVYGDEATKDKALDVMMSYNEDIQQYKFIEEDGKKNLYALVEDKTAVDGQALVPILRDFNSLKPEEIARQLIFSERVNILDDNAKQFYTESMAMAGFGADVAKSYGLDTDMTRLIGAGIEVKSGETQQPYVPLATRSAAQKSGVKLQGQTVFDELFTLPESSSNAKKAISDAYQKAPAGGRISQNPLNNDNMQLNALSRANSLKIHDDSYGPFGKNTQLLEVRLKPEVGPSFVLPIHGDYDIKEAIPRIMAFIDQKVIDERKMSDYNPFTLDDIKKFMGDYGTNKEYFDKFQTGYKNLLDKGERTIIGGSLGIGQTAQTADDGGGDAAGAGDDASPNPGNDLFKKKKPVTNPSQPETQSKPVLPVLKVDVGDGKDYQRRMLNFENTRGSSSGGGVSNYGFTGADMKSKFDKESGTKEEKALKVIDKYIIGQNKSTSKSILKDLGIDRSTFDALPETVKEQLVDWKFNTGRSVADLVYIASGMDPNYTGFDAHRARAKTPSEISGIDISKLTKSALNKARKELYEGRIKSMEDMLAQGNTNVTQSDINFAKQGYNNSQKYRLQ